MRRKLTISMAFAVFVLVCASLGAGISADEIRGVWVDAWGAGFLNQSQVETLLGKPGDPNKGGAIRDSNLNAVFVQVRRRADVCYPSGMGEPYFSGLTPSDFNALQAMIAAAHDTTGGKQRIEVHCWIVVFATASSSSPPASSIYWQHNNPADIDNYWMTLDDEGNETSDKAFDPGHPKCLEYITNVCMDLITRFDIDGLHYDYIRFTGNDQGYNPVSIARFNERYGRTGQPSPTNEQFKQWRRDQVTALVRQVYARTQLVKPNVKVSGAFVTWNPSPTSSTRSGFQATRPYYDVYSDWDSWMQEGIVDLAVPMTYYNWEKLPVDYVRWMNFEKDRKGNRHMAIGPGIYLNSLSNAINELLMTRDPSPSGNYAQGFVGYSYRVPYNGGTWSGFAPTLKSQVTPTRAEIPPMPWKTNPTTGHLLGVITDFGTGNWVDGGTVVAQGPVTRSTWTDGTGFYAFIDLPPGQYTVTANKSGLPTASAQVTITAGNAVQLDLALGQNLPPVISNVQASGITSSGATITWETNAPSTSRVEYGTTPAYGMSTLVNTQKVTSHSVQLTGLSPSTPYYYKVISFNDFGESSSGGHTFVSGGPPQISNARVTGVTSSSATIAWDTSTPANSLVRYGPTSAYGSQTPLDSGEVTSHLVTISGLAPNTTYHCQAVSANNYGGDESADIQFKTSAFAGDVIVDGTTDAGFEFLSGEWTLGTASAKVGVDYFWSWSAGSASESAATHKARWTPDLPVSGNWDVYVYYARGTNRSTQSYFKVTNAGEVQNIRLNQQINGNDWTLLCSSVPFHAGTQGNVQLWNNTPDGDKIVQGDAVKWVYLGGDIDPPTAPSGLTAQAASTTSMQLHWNPATDDHGVTGYNIYRGAKIGTASGTSFLDQSGLSPNTVYEYRVSASDEQGNEGQKSAAAAAATLSVPPSSATVTCSAEAGQWQSSNQFTFTAVGGFGPGKVHHYRYAWTQSTTHTFTGDETAWSSGDLLLAASDPGSYYLHVRGYNSQDVPNGELTLGPYQYDASAPVVETVEDEGVTGSTETLNASWTASAPASGIQKFEYSVGTTPGGSDVLGWTDAGTSTSAAISGLSLTVGQTYFVNVRATSNADVVSAVTSSGGVTVAAQADSIGQAKALPDGSPVALSGKTVSAVFPSGFYMQEADRSSGIFVEYAGAVTVSQSVGVTGVLALQGDIERAIVDAIVVGGDTGAPALPLYVAQSGLGGGPLNEHTPGITGGQGLNNIGLLVRIHGRVTALLDAAFYVDDGSGRSDGNGNTGVKVKTAGAPAVSVDQWAIVTGISSCWKSGESVLPLILARDVDTLE